MKNVIACTLHYALHYDYSSTLPNIILPSSQPIFMLYAFYALVFFMIWALILKKVIWRPSLPPRGTH